MNSNADLVLSVLSLIVVVGSFWILWHVHPRLWH